MLEKRSLRGNFSILSFPVELGSDARGLGEAPQVLRNLGLKKILESGGGKVTDCGDVKVSNVEGCTVEGMKNFEPILKMLQEGAQIVKERIDQGDRMVVLGGDHSISIGSISGAVAGSDGEVGVIWIDSHADLNTNKNSPTGNIHGMSSAVILGEGHEKLVNLLGSGPKVKKENILYVGLKDLDHSEIDFINVNNLSAVTIPDFINGGFSEISEKIKALEKRVKYIWVSMDLDSIDKEFCPASPMATKGGFTYREIVFIAKTIGRLSNVIGLDIVEWVPKKDKDNITANLALELITAILGSEHSFYTEYIQKHHK